MALLGHWRWWAKLKQRFQKMLNTRPQQDQKVNFPKDGSIMCHLLLVSLSPSATLLHSTSPYQFSLRLHPSLECSAGTTWQESWASTWLSGLLTVPPGISRCVSWLKPPNARRLINFIPFLNPGRGQSIGVPLLLRCCSRSNQLKLVGEGEGLNWITC